MQIDDSQSLWATKTLNDDNDVGNATVVNLAERKAFVIEPFNIPVSTAAVKYSIEREGYTVEPAYDLNTKGEEEDRRSFLFWREGFSFLSFFALRCSPLFCLLLPSYLSTHIIPLSALSLSLSLSALSLSPTPPHQQRRRQKKKKNSPQAPSSR